MKGRLSKQILSTILALVMLLSLLPAAVLASTPKATLITDASALKAGDQVIIANATADYALGTTQKTNNRAAVAVTGSEGSITLTDDVQILTLKNGTKDGTWAFDTGAGYLYAASSSKNYLRTETILTENSSWKISIAADGVATIKAQGEYTRNWLRFNPNNGTPLFAAYSSGQQDIALYKLTSTGSEADTVATPAASPASGALAAGETVTLTCATADAVIQYKIGSGAYQAYTAPIAINEDCTLTVKATKAGMTDSAEAVFTYTVKAEEEQSYTKADTIASGDQVVIYNPKNSKIMTTTKKVYNNKDQLESAAAVVTGDKLTTEAENAAVLTVTKDDSGKYTFTTEDGKYLYMDSSHVRLVDEAGANTLFQLETATDGWFIRADTANYSGKAQYLEFYADVFTVYGMNSSKADIYTFQFYKVDRATDPVTGLQDGDQVAIYNDGNGKAVGSTSSGNKLTAVTAALDGDKIKPAEGMAIFTVRVNDEGQLTFVCDGKYLTSASTGNGLSLSNAESAYSLWEAEKSGDAFYLKNLNAAYNGKAQYLEYYNAFTTYGLSSGGKNYAMTFRKVAEASSTDPLTVGSQVVIYNQNAQAVLAAQDDNESSPAINKAAATIEDGKAVCANGAVVFTVEQNGEYYRFRNDTYGYLCANGTGNNAFYSKTASDDADWLVRTCSGGVGDYEMESRTAKYNGYSQWLEYYSDSFKVYSMYKVTDYTIYSFSFYPVAEGTVVTRGIVNKPTVIFGALPEAYAGQDYSFTFKVDAAFGVNGAPDANIVDGDYPLIPTEPDGETFRVTVPAAYLAGRNSITVRILGSDHAGVAFTGDAMITILDEPVFSDLTPAMGSQTGENKRPVISARVANAGEDPTITMTLNGETVTPTYEDGVVRYRSGTDMEDGRVNVTLTVTRQDGKSATKSWYFTVGEARYQLYFGQLHSHTTYSDGSGTLDSALEYVKNLPEDANVQFVAFTDHSNYFDKSGEANPEGALYDMSLASTYSQDLWTKYKSTIAAFNASQSDVIAIGGFEMTWSGGPGHINTFNSPGIVSRNNSTLNNKTNDAGLQAYYSLLSQSEGVDTISQLNHPGSTFGNFSDFAYWNGAIDSRVYMVEVGNGEGQVGAGGYYPSYEQYIMALDKGWHVAPTNNQDNHKGKWGNANDARDVIITDDFTEEGLYEAIRERRMYATEDKNLELGYTVNGCLMGAEIAEIPSVLDIQVTVCDPDKSDAISKVELVANSGRVVYTWNNPADLAAGVLSAELAPDYSYYFVRVTEADGDLAVTAPVWVGDTLMLGISNVVCGTATPVTGEELTLTTTLFNSEDTDATVTSLTYTIAGGESIGLDTAGYKLSAGGTLDVTFKWTPNKARVTTVTVTAVVEQDGKEYTFTKDIELDVLDADKLVYIGIDASHHNEYVAGNYKDSMGNFGKLAAEYSVRTVQLNTSEYLIAACSNPKYKAIILTAPSRRDGSALRSPYDTYSDAEIAAIAAFNASGGAVVLCGWGDYYESYATFPAEDHMAAQQNKILAALGSSLRISDDETKDDTHNGGQPQRLYLSSYHFDSFLLDGVEYDAENPYNNLYTELYSQYGGASIYVVDGSGAPSTVVPGTVTPVVYGFATTYSSDDDRDNFGGLGMVPKYAYAENDNRLDNRLMVMATEQLDGKGLIVVSGAAFLSNFEVQATISDSGSEKNYSNYKICENLVRYINPATVTDIKTVRQQTETGFKYTIEGVVTSNASGYDKDTAFFDCIYVQDETGGICCFPVAGNFKVGDRVRVTGTTDFYQGEPELQVSAIEKIGEADPVTPTQVTASEINDRSAEGKLVTLKGYVAAIELENGLIQTILVRDAQGNVARVFIDGYITTASEVENAVVGCEIQVTGLASYDDTFNAPDGPFPRIRIRDRADVVCTAHTHAFGDWTVTTPATCTEPGTKSRSCACGAVETATIPATGHHYVDGVCTACGALQSESVETGDTGGIELWIAMLSVSMLGAVLVLRGKKRRA